jgi:hypothetical protein
MKQLIALMLPFIMVASSFAKDDPPKPTSHTKRDIEGFTVHVDDRLLKDEAELGTKALKLLEGQIRLVVMVVPEDKLKLLRKVPMWLDFTHGKLVSPQYHPSSEWLAGNGYSRDLTQCVHFPDAKYFCNARFQRHQPWGVMHELAHAYHDRVLGFNHAEIKQAWETFRKNERYQKTLHVDGREHKHYALTNEKEFFAEMTESYFGQNDFFPFNSGELQKEEPAIFKLLEKIWGKLP